MADTIYAPSSAIGGAIAVIRISGDAAMQATRIFDRGFTAKPGYLRHVKCMAGEQVIDDCMAVFFHAPHTYTGEDMVEINCHGGPMTVQTILSLLGKQGFRPAEPGEFTQRAFENGKMDLSQAEAVMDIVSAGAERSLNAAILQLEGGVKDAVLEIENRLTDALSGIDAAIDYPDEAEEDTLERLPSELETAKTGLNALIENGRRNRVLRDGVRIVILGRPNVGKSSLLNRLMNEDRAIVTDIPGTTRDILDEKAVISGVPIRFIDTAGIRNTRDQVEQIGVDRARRAAETADLVLLMLDGSTELSTDDRNLLEETNGKKRLILLNKCDLPQKMSLPDKEFLQISAKEGLGIDALRSKLLELTAPGSAEETIITNERHIRLLELAEEALNAIPQNEFELDCAATDIRDALKCLGNITGSDIDESVIDQIFSRFCVGK